MTESEIKGLVFDIERFAVHDGQGIRTTVFLKGCPLRCRWCHNPEGLEVRRRPVFRKEKCMYCHHCQQSFDSISWNQERDRPVFSMEEDDFDQAVYDCPTNAITYDSKWISPQELVKQLEKDKPFFRDEGGVTFSGGEPLRQSEFLLDCLKLCRKKGIHTAIETSLCANPEAVKKAAPLLDQIFFDIKILDDKTHQAMTSASNLLILKNAAWLLESPYADRITARTPLIPGCTATKENIEAIADFIASHNPDVRYELLNFNPLASSKYELAGKDYTLDPTLKKFSPSQMEEFRNLARAKGVKNIIE